MGGGTGTNAKLPPISAMITGSFTNTNKDATDVPKGFDANNNFKWRLAYLYNTLDGTNAVGISLTNLDYGEEDVTTVAAPDGTGLSVG